MSKKDPSRALVLGGGGVAGIAWETGVLFGLFEHGVDLYATDLVVGTSAGSTMGAQLLSGTPLGQLYDRHVFPPKESTEIAVEFDPQELMSKWSELLSTHEPGGAMRAAIGRMAVAASTVPERKRRAVIEARLPSHDWPDTALQIVVVDAGTGEPRVLTRNDDISLVDAVAASCAVPGIWPPVTIGDHRYVDGGVRSSVNLDLAADQDVVLALAPVPDLLALEPDIEKAAKAVRKKRRCLLIEPDDASKEAIGPNPLDPSVAPAAARAGRAQAANVVDEVKKVWA